jgi:hypothetical protein
MAATGALKRAGTSFNLVTAAALSTEPLGADCEMSQALAEPSVTSTVLGDEQAVLTKEFLETPFATEEGEKVFEEELGGGGGGLVEASGTIIPKLTDDLAWVGCGFPKEQTKATPPSSFPLLEKAGLLAAGTLTPNLQEIVFVDLPCENVKSLRIEAFRGDLLEAGLNPERGLKLHKVEACDGASGVFKEIRSVDGWLQWVSVPSATDLEKGAILLPQEVLKLVNLGKRALAAGWEPEELEDLSEQVSKKANLGLGGEGSSASTEKL